MDDGKVNPNQGELREMIEGALEEIERTELEMLDLLADMLGPERAQQVADYIAATQKEQRLEALLHAPRKDEPGQPNRSPP
jgi:hypothetical protein